MTFQELSLDEVYPGTLLLAKVYNGKEGYSVCRWGFPLKGKLVINARSETFAASAFYRDTWPCVIPAAGYYEWSKDRDKYYFTGKDTLFMAGLVKKTDGELRAVILTEAAKGPNSEIHHRQPVLLGRDGISVWLREKRLIPQEEALSIERM